MPNFMDEDDHDCSEHMGYGSPCSICGRKYSKTNYEEESHMKFQDLAREVAPRLFKNEYRPDATSKYTHRGSSSKWKLPPQEQPKCIWIRGKNEWLVGVPNDSELLTTGRTVIVTSKSGEKKTVTLSAKADFPNKVVENISYKAFHIIRERIFEEIKIVDDFYDFRDDFDF